MAKTFSTTVNLRSRKDMEEYLAGHFRYLTMNPWNLSTSYAQDVKVQHLGLGPLQEKAFQIIEQGDVFDDINATLRDWQEDHDFTYQVGFNGRSQGYLVLYQGGRSADGKVYVKPGLGMDEERDFQDWGIESLRERVKLVQEFDTLADDLLAILVDYCEQYKVVEKRIRVPKMVRVLVPVA